MMIEFSEAKSIAESIVSSFADDAQLDLLIMEDRTIEGLEGWVFFYNSADYIKYRRPMDALAGNGPIIVYKDGRVEVVPSFIRVEDAYKMVGLNGP